MAARLTRADVERMAALAHLDLAPDDVDRFTRQLAAILDYAARLQTVDVSGVDADWRPPGPTADPRADAAGTSLPRDDALANAPDGVPTPGAAAGGYFRVPRVLG